MILPTIVRGNYSLSSLSVSCCVFQCFVHYSCVCVCVCVCVASVVACIVFFFDSLSDHYHLFLWFYGFIHSCWGLWDVSSLSLSLDGVMRCPSCFCGLMICFSFFQKLYTMEQTYQNAINIYDILLVCTAGGVAASSLRRGGPCFIFVSCVWNCLRVCVCVSGKSEKNTSLEYKNNTKYNTPKRERKKKRYG